MSGPASLYKFIYKIPAGLLHLDIIGPLYMSSTMNFVAPM